MNKTKSNKIAYRVFCFIISSFLILGGLGMLSNNLFIKAGICLIAAGMIGWLAFKTPSIKLWTAVLLLLLLTMYLIGIIKNEAGIFI